MSDVISEPQANEEEQDLSEILRIRRTKLTDLKAEQKNPFEITTCIRTAYAQQIIDRFAELDATEVSIAGRIMSWRDMGKANFIDVRDASGKI
ncbi:MAG: lysine--tRNA ligase, partial [Acetanaerobacterium sp.]